MSNLSASAQQLVRSGIKAARPAAADRERVFEALRQQLGDAVMLGHVGGATAAHTAGTAVWVKLSVLAAGLGLVAGGVAFGLRSEPAAVAPLVQRPLAAQVMPVMTPRNEEAADPTPSPAVIPTPVAETAATGSAPRRSGDRLAQEVALLSRATSALRAGRPNEALKLLNQHQSQFPLGLLVEERRAARAQAMCALGRRSEGERELSGLSPSSPQAARARQACETAP